MTAALWLAAAAVAAVAASLVGWPAYRESRARHEAATNADRYLAWRGRARRPTTRSAAEEHRRRRERQRLWLAAGLALVSIGCLVAFFAFAS